MAVHQTLVVQEELVAVVLAAEQQVHLQAVLDAYSFTTRR
jgi:hypothetical protein